VAKPSTEEGMQSFCAMVPAGAEARTALEKRVGSSPVKCEVKNKDIYGRNVSVCYGGPNGEDLNAWMVSQGEAVAYTQYSKEYVPLSKDAEASKKVCGSTVYSIGLSKESNQLRAIARFSCSRNSQMCVIKTASRIVPRGACVRNFIFSSKNSAVVCREFGVVSSRSQPSGARTIPAQVEKQVWILIACW
jgi:hypothetical protein